MKKEITTKDIMALNELMTFENWMATKMNMFYENATEKALKTMFKEMAIKHLESHDKLLNYLKTNAKMIKLAIKTILSAKKGTSLNIGIN